MTKLAEIIVPTDDRRHIGKIREGKISFEKFSRANREAIPVDLDVLHSKEYVGGRKVKDAAQVVSQGSAEGSTGDAEKVRGKEGQAGVLRSRKQVRKRKDSTGKSEKHVQARSTSKARARKKKVSND